MEGFLSSYQIVRYEGYVLALEDVLEVLDKNIDVREWVEERRKLIGNILKKDKQAKFKYFLGEHATLF